MNVENFEIGQVVISKSGRDATNKFVIIRIENEYLYLVDGSLRTLLKPKKKKIKHVQITNNINNELQQKIINKEYILDSDFRKYLKTI